MESDVKENIWRFLAKWMEGLDLCRFIIVILFLLCLYSIYSSHSARKAGVHFDQNTRTVIMQQEMKN